MSDLLKEFDFNLTTTIQYHGPSGATLEEGSFLVVKAPSNKQLKDVLKLRQAISKAIFKKSEESASLESSKIKVTDGGVEAASAGVMMMLFSSCENITEVFESFRRIITSGCCKIDGQIALNADHFEKMSEHDSSTLLGRYVYSFFMLSLTNSLKKD